MGVWISSHRSKIHARLQGWWDLQLNLGAADSPLTSCLMADDGGDRLLSAEDLVGAGELFVDLLCKMKHNGAVEKCIEGFHALVERSASPAT